jgi:hypothetical protein
VRSFIIKKMSLDQFLLFQDVESPQFRKGNLERGGTISLYCRDGAVWLDLIEEILY